MNRYDFVRLYNELAIGIEYFQKPLFLNEK